MKEQTVDRRVRKTKSQLRSCLSILLETKKIQNITVKELAQMADINRGTFTCIIKMCMTYLNIFKKIF